MTQESERDSRLEPGAAPSVDAGHYTCPHCSVYAQMEPHDLFIQYPQGFSRTGFLQLHLCGSCGRAILWFTPDSDAWSMVYPLGSFGAKPNADMPEAVRQIYEEARSVYAISLRSAAALLRLALQMLVDDLVPGSDPINSKIGSLVKNGLDPQVQQAMDILRVVGNNAVHPGEIELDSDPELVSSLFVLINLIVEQTISRPKHVASLFGGLPAKSLAQISRRDGTTP